MRHRLVPAAVLAIAAQSIGISAAAAAPATPVDVTFNYTGAEQSWDVPLGVNSIHVVLVGGPGGSTPFGGPTGGRPASLTGDLDVTAGTTIYIEVGGAGQGAPGTAFNGGGAGGTGGSVNPGQGGGGASDIRTVSRTAASGSLASRLLVAAGGGGAGGGEGLAGGFGGDAGLAGSDGQTPTHGTGGHEGTDVAGGAAGLPGGAAGTAGLGGAGASQAGGSGGGGGGGGYFGGGGGGSTTDINFGAGAGGGGSTYRGAATNTVLSLISSGIPHVVITYTPANNSSSLDATVTMAASVVCVALDTSSVDFGTRQFGDVGVAATPGVTVSNCSSIAEDVLAHGSDASGQGPTTWTLDDTGTCGGGTLPIDHFGLAIEREDTNAQVRLSANNKPLESLSNGASLANLARIDTPCPGGSGAGVVMSMQLTFVATEPAP